MREKIGGVRTVTRNILKITGGFGNPGAFDVLRAVEHFDHLIPPQMLRKIRYKLTYDTYHLTRTKLFKELPYYVTEIQSFPLFSGFSDYIEKVAEFRGEHGEQVEFRHRNTKIIYSAEIYVEEACEVFGKGIEIGRNEE
jgi:hypothetical protein